LVLSLLFIVQTAEAQLFSRERLINNEHFDKARWSWGYFLGFNNYDFKFEYINETGQPDIEVQTSAGFNVGLIGNLRLHEYFDLRLEPGLFYTERNLIYPGFEEERDYLREAKSTYIHIPLLLKVSTKRLNNIKPFIIGGVSTSVNLSSNENNPEDNSVARFRMTKNTYYYELGFGIDFYLFYFKFTPSIRGVFALSDELIRDNDPNSPYTSNIDRMMSRGVFINFTFQ
jgi:hypothetical protein